MSSLKTTLHPAARADRTIRASQKDNLCNRWRSIAARINSVVTWTTLALRVGRHVLLRDLCRQTGSRHCDEVFLEYLGREHGGLIFEVRREQFSSGFPLLRIVSSLSIDEDVRIEEGSLGHYSPRRRRPTRSSYSSSRSNL